MSVLGLLKRTSIDGPGVCRGEQPIDVQWIAWPYMKPPALVDHPSSDWSIPQFQIPSHCEAIESGKAGKLNSQFLEEANHPCTFLKTVYGLPLKLSELVTERLSPELPMP